MIAKGEERWGWDGVGVWGYQMQTSIYRMDQYQGPTIEHRELYSIFCDKPQWDRIFCVYIYVYVYICVCIHTHTHTHTHKKAAEDEIVG